MVWLDILASASVALAVACAALVVVMLIARPQRMAIMDVVWPVTALYWGPVGVWGLWDMGSPPLSPARREEAQRREQRKQPAKPFWKQVAVAVTHCGAGCTLGDIVGEWIVYAFHWKVAGETLYAEFVLDLPLAFGLGVVFQYFTIAPMRGLGLKDGILAAVKADTASILAFEVGLFGWMALDALVLFPGQGIAAWNHWFQMQIGMIVGFFTCCPANAVLLETGLKEAM